MTSTGFRYGEHDTSYLAAGGMDGLRHLAEEFYRQMNSLPQAAAVRAAVVVVAKARRGQSS